MCTMRYGTLLGAFLLLTGCGGGSDAAEQPADMPQPETTAPPAAPAPANVALPEGVTPEMVAAGQQVFNGTICFTCHGMNGTGGPLAPALNDQNWLNIPDGSFENIMNVIRQGVATPKEYPAPMPPMGGVQLDDEQLRAVSAYVYSLSHGG
ncbi:MAG TPA: cytochrome c [Longimicrobiales bacterium]|nr:cytochrome c [Longimicrobiales bacterium]